MASCVSSSFCPLFCTPNLPTNPPSDNLQDPIGKEITWSVSVSLRMVHIMTEVQSTILQWTNFSNKSPLLNRVVLISLRTVGLLGASVITAALFPVHLLEVALRIFTFYSSKFLYTALLYDYWKGDPWFTNPVAKFPNKIGATVLVNGSTLLSSLYTAKELLFAEDPIVLSEVVDSASFGLAPRVIRRVYGE